jgi:hypothetical protein
MLKTKSGLPKHCCWVIDRHGKRRVRFRKNGVDTYITGTPWGETFMRQHAAALERADETSVPSGPGGAGSIDAVISSYKKLVFPTVKPSTQAMRRGVLDRFAVEFGRDQIADFKRQHIAAIIAAKSATPHAANSLRKILGYLFEHAIEINLIEDNPVIGTKRLKTAGRGFHTWTDDEIERYRAHWPLGTQQRSCMELALETTSRRKDVALIGPQHRRMTPHGEVLDLRHTKNDSNAFIQLTDELRAAIDACPTKHLTYLHTKRGTPRSEKALGGDFRNWCDAAGLPARCALHGLRKGSLRRGAEAEMTTKQLQAWGGHKSLSALQPYIDDADKAKLARQAYEKLRKARARR